MENRNGCLVCGAGMGTGIFISIVTGATSLSIEEWRLSNLATAKSLLSISEHGGPLMVGILQIMKSTRHFRFNQAVGLV
jgi:hypothetical protein